MRRPSLVLLFISLFGSSLFATEPFATMKSIQHVICTNLGSVEFEINGNPDDYTFYWEHGPTTLRLENLAAGNYTFVVINSVGCEEKYPVEILVMTSECKLTYNTRYSGLCSGVIQLEFTMTSTILNTGSLIITWDDGYQGGLTRYYQLDEGFVGCVVVEVEGGCCDPQEVCFNFPPQGCNGKAPPGKTDGIRGQVIVNEVSRGVARADGSFVELLVLGDGKCGDTFDISGYILDDNNGSLIHGNNLLTNSNKEKIGINNGYLSFKKGNSVWKNIPNGSLIVIQPSFNAVLADDPVDANGDHVYVVSASDNTLFSGHSGVWNEYEKTIEYKIGQSLEPSWGLIEFGGDADGIQVRTPDGKLCHGVSCGKSSFSSGEKFEMWLSDNIFDFAYTGYDWFDPKAFTAPESFSPGNSNSELNAALISSFFDCDTLLERGQFLGQNTPSNTSGVVTLFPNPAEDVLNVRIAREYGGKVAMKVLNTVGQVIYSDSWEYQGRRDTKVIQWSKALLPSGWYTVEFDFGDGVKEYRRLVIVF